MVSRIPLALLVISEGDVMSGFWDTKSRGEKKRKMGKLRNVTRRSLCVPEIGGLPAAPGGVAPDGLAACAAITLCHWLLLNRFFWICHICLQRPVWLPTVSTRDQYNVGGGYYWVLLRSSIWQFFVSLVYVKREMYTVSFLIILSDIEDWFIWT